jgi:hypothetical protein
MVAAIRRAIFTAALASFSVACGTTVDDATASAGKTALVATPPASGCTPGKEGEVCGTEARLGCDVGLVCDAPDSLLVSEPAGVCRAPNRPPAANPSKPACAPSKAGGLCGSEAGFVCGPGLTCILPDTGTGLIVPTGTCRIAEGGPCTPEPLINSGCAGMLLCDFDRELDPDGKNAKCVTPVAANARPCDLALNAIVAAALRAQSFRCRAPAGRASSSRFARRSPPTESSASTAAGSPAGSARTVSCARSPTDSCPAPREPA